MSKKSHIEIFYDNFYYPEFENLTTWHQYVGQFLEQYSTKNIALLDVGCYRWYLFKMLKTKYEYDKENLYGIDISPECVKIASTYANSVIQGDITQKNWEQKFISKNIKVVIATEILEHIEDYNTLLSGINKLLPSWWLLIVSFPNYLNILRYLRKKFAELANRPKMIYLQPIEKEYNYFKVKGDISKMWFQLINQKSWLFLYKNFSWFNGILNYFQMHWLAFCPVLVFKKK